MPETFPAQWTDRYEYGEREQVRRWRFLQARRVGLSHLEANVFADGQGDTGALRAAARRGATHEQLVHIFL